LGLTERPSELRQLGTTEEEEDDHQDDDQFGWSEVHGLTVTLLLVGYHVAESKRLSPATSRRSRSHLGTSLLCKTGHVLECVVNISEGRDEHAIATIAAAAGSDLLDVHTDPHHHRSVLTLVGEDAPRAVTTAAVAHI